NNSERPRLHHDLLSDDGRVGSEAALPQTMTDNCDRTPAFVECRWFVVFGNERSAENRLDPEHGKEPGRHACAWDRLRFRSVATEVGGTGPIGRSAREEIGLLRPIGEIKIRNIAVGNAGRRILS